MAGTFKASEEIELVEREKVCIAEIWQVCLGGDLKYLKKRDSIELNGILTGLNGWIRNKNPKFFGKYGRQKGFERSRIIIYNPKKYKKQGLIK